ncbi:MAG: 1-(5-phosphoribosyl)-5-[(5-phosphoribosylamino)methylideneamino]imidazole-4-carboxamide isomerase [Blastocatellia bacterium]|nr:1-(5-phosphoribosyl)-5-[(5-phosphoribosylamino)methylideneamino]imidazole-4-carboxamide isomerase [Blastocatellia bacterium]MCS7157566.1 1-(5-phosphoribosyl)-5-[(5-phosphoribosylamino)methylideneamino]imidazole-4-carboxamide isomerase [Blastocatellia bacterium]MCX7753518.1 1-(5-phosphoribosyl)-5-[(5-phosphoribosylamino)methylideneamino]imidazole-4-carboxamide isomerase [Blastocatellia bacterium]MDW8166934.1 1-(5-phosphoribosyl)-5-[(5-phosphoribosylamino)methylideneamino]imidazole-4-carboxamid
MELLAALDLFMGKVVRLTRGQIATAKVYSADPMATAKRWQEQKADALHLVDLDAALGLGSNFSVIQQLVRGVTIPVQLGGGIRSERAAREWLERGVARIVLGTLAMKDPACVGRLIEAFGPERIVVALDFSRERVVTEGWTRPTSVTVEEALSRFRDYGVRRFLVTAVERDGTLSGPDFHIYAELSAVSDVRILASGGISRVSDVVELKRAGIEGVVIGKALYEGWMTLEEIRRALAEEERRSIPSSDAERPSEA